MTQQHFSALPLQMQTAVVKRQGVFLCERTSKNIVVYLFQLDAFYVEVFYDRDVARVILINNFYNTDLLRPYLEQIDLLKLLS